MKRSILLMGLAAVIAGSIATLHTLVATASPAAPMTGSFTTSDFAFTAADGTSTVTIAAGGTVDFSYPTGSSRHNVDFGTGPQPTSCTLGGQSQAPPIPASATAPGWSGSCTFDNPGTYTFHCDLHTFMTGTVIVESASSPNPPPAPPPVGTPPGSGPSPGPQPGPGSPNPSPSPTMPMPMPPGSMPMPMPTPAPAGGQSTTPQSPPVKRSPLAGSARHAIELTGSKGGEQVHGTIRVSEAGRGGHAVITVLASRAALRHGAPHTQLTKLGSARVDHLKPGAVKFKVDVKSPGRQALMTYRHLAVTIRITVVAPDAKTVTLSKEVVLRA